MAAGGRIAGITIQIDGDATPLQKALSGIDSSLKTVQGDLKDVNRELKFNPDSLGLWEEKQRLVNQAMETTKERLTVLQENYAQLAARMEEADPNSEEYAELQEQMGRLSTEIALTESQLQTYGQQSEEAAANVDRLSSAAEDAEGGIEGEGDAASDTAGQMGELASETDNAGKAAENSSNQGWTMARQMLVDLAEQGIKAAIDGLKRLGGSMKDAVTDSAAFADEVNTLAKQTHLSTDTIQELYYATELMDVPVETVSKSLTKLTNSMSDATVEGSNAAEAYDRLGISVIDTNGEMRSADAVFMDVIDALGQIDNEAERDAAAYDLFGRSAKELNPLIDMGSAGFAELQQEARAAGAVMSGDTLNSLNETQDAMDRMDQAVLVVQRNFASALAPAITAVGNELSALSADTDWQDVFSDLGDAVADILPDLLSMAKQALPAIISITREVIPIVSQIVSYLPMLQPLIDAILMVLQRLSPILARLLADLLPPLIDVLVAVLPILEPILDILEPLLQILGPLLSAVLEALAVILKALVQVITASVQPVIQSLQKQVEKLAPVFQNCSNWLKSLNVDFKTIWTNIQTTVSTAVANVKDKVTNTFNAIKTTATTIWNNIKSAIMNPIEAAVSGVTNAVSKIKSSLSGFTVNLGKIKLPHFKISGSLSINPPRVPKLTVDWYARAMEEGMILNSPTIFGMNGSTLLGGGEAGPEAVVGVRSLREMISTAVESAGATNNVNIVVYGAPGQDVNELADIIENRINANITRRRAAF